MSLVLKSIFQNIDLEYRVLLLDANASYAPSTSFVVYSCLKQRHWWVSFSIEFPQQLKLLRGELINNLQP